MLTQRAKYGLKAAQYLATQSEPVSIATIAEEIGAPRKFLEAILNELRGRGLLDSRRGAAGGYRLARAPEEISFADIIRAIDGPLAMAPCASRTAYRPCADCADVRTCTLRPFLLAARDAVSEVLESTTLKVAPRKVTKKKV